MSVVANSLIYKIVSFKNRFINITKKYLTLKQIYFTEI